MMNFAKNIVRVLVALCVYMATSHAANIPLPGLRSNRLSNALTPNAANYNYDLNDWVKISEAPPAVVSQQMGARVELECEAVGSPSPTIQWIKGDRALTENESYESNMINENLSQGLSKIKSRLIINKVMPIHQGPFTCVASTGSKTAMAVTSLYIPNTKPGVQMNFSDYLTTNMIPMSHPKVRIVLFNTVIMEPMGVELIIPCKAVGSPKPDIFWIDANNEQIIGSQNPRFKILPDGELRIQDLTWSDMGAYTCIARNDFSKDSITTFVYPLLNEN